MVSIPPHTSHRLQPLDLTIFGPLSTAFNEACDAKMKELDHVAINPEQLPSLRQHGTGLVLVRKQLMVLQRLEFIHSIQTSLPMTSFMSTLPKKTSKMKLQPFLLRKYRKKSLNYRMILFSRWKWQMRLR